MNVYTGDLSNWLKAMFCPLHVTINDLSFGEGTGGLHILPVWNPSIQKHKYISETNKRPGHIFSRMEWILFQMLLWVNSM